MRSSGQQSEWSAQIGTHKLGIRHRAHGWKPLWVRHGCVSLDNETCGLHEKVFWAVHPHRCADWVAGRACVPLADSKVADAESGGYMLSCSHMQT